MISDELKSEIRRLFYVRHFTANAIASSLGIHRDTVMKAIELREAERIASESELDRFEGKIKETLHIYPKLQGTRIHQMLKEQGYTGSLRHLRRRLRSLRLPIKDRFYMKPSYIAGECAQVDWAHVGTLKVGKAERKLSAFVMVLAWSRRMFVYFTFDQKIETLLDCHVKAFVAFGGVPRSILYDNMKTVVVERLGQSIRYHESLLEFCQHWLFQPSVCAPYQPQSKGRVERSIRYLRGAFFEARAISEIRALNDQVKAWCEAEASERQWPDDPSRKVFEAFLEEQKVLIPLPDKMQSPPRKTILKADRYGYIHFDRNLYSVPLAAASIPLSIWIYEDFIVISDGKEELARHKRSYDAGEKVEDRGHREAIESYRNKPRISHAIQKLSEDLPDLEALIRQWIESQLDTKALTNFVSKAKDLHGADRVNQVVLRALKQNASRIEDLSCYLGESLQVIEANPPLNLILPENPAVRDLTIRSHDLNLYDDL
jgi:transposase